MEMSNRNPYPFPKLENDTDFYGQNLTQKRPYADPTHVAQTQDPWSRLNKTCTLSSERRGYFNHDPQAPRDSLDFVLKSDYDNHKHIFQTKAEVLTQPETIGADHGRILKNREPEPVPEPPSPTKGLKFIHTQKKESIHSVKGAVECNHTPATNQGFSRKHDGGFYTT